MLVEENKPLAPFTTFGIGGRARWFTVATTEDEIAESASWAEEHELPLFVLGGGSNLLVSDSGFDGLVMRVGLRGVAVEPSSGELHKVIYKVAAGEDWDRFVERAVDDDCAGIECLAGIPGTVGGTPVQNVGAYGQEVSSTIECVRAFDLHKHAFEDLSAAECGFAYRRSRFNTVDRGRYVVTRVDYALARGGAATLRYADLQRAVAAETSASLKEVAAIVRVVRHVKGMLLVDGDADCRSAGSFFKNPIVTREQVERVKASAREQPPQFSGGADAERAGLVKLPAAWLIERAGFAKGYMRGAAGVSSRHTLALINCGGAKAEDILALADEIRDAVLERFGVTLEMEPVLVGFESDRN